MESYPYPTSLSCWSSSRAHSTNRDLTIPSYTYRPCTSKLLPDQVKLSANLFETLRVMLISFERHRKLETYPPPHGEPILSKTWTERSKICEDRVLYIVYVVKYTNTHRSRWSSSCINLPAPASLTQVIGDFLFQSVNRKENIPRFCHCIQFVQKISLFQTENFVRTEMRKSVLVIS